MNEVLRAHAAREVEQALRSGRWCPSAWRESLDAALADIGMPANTEQRLRLVGFRWRWLN